MIKKSLGVFCYLAISILTACTASGATPAASKQPLAAQQSWLGSVFNPDLWHAINHSESLPYDTTQSDITKQIALYSSNPRYIELLTHNAQPYLYYVYQQTQQRHMPAELALLPMVESNYNPFLYSKQGATGLWQIMPGTASGFHLDINWWYDGRRDVRASTQAALDYMDYLHNYFHNWLLAIAAYNCGEGTVLKAINHNKKLHKPTDFWSLSLPYQTKIYVPKLLALATILKNPKQYNITLPYAPNKPYFTPVKMSGQIDFELIAKLANMKVHDIRLLNPGYRRFATAPATDYALLLPIEKADTFSDNLNSNSQQRVNWRHHIVQSGDTLGSIAHRYHTHVAILQRVNNLRSTLIHPQQNLLIPLTNNTTFNPSVTIQQGNIAEDHVPGPKRIKYVVQPKDTLASIGRHYGVTAAAIRFWNNLSASYTLHPNETLTLWQSSRTHHNTKPIAYTVKAGDSLSTVAHHYHVSVDSLKQNNHLNGNVIKIGQTLYITPVTYSGSKQHFTPKHSNEMIIHTVNAGENLSGIAHYYHVSVHQLSEWNHLKSSSVIKIGQKLQIYPKSNITS